MSAPDPSRAFERAGYGERIVVEVSGPPRNLKLARA